MTHITLTSNQVELNLPVTISCTSFGFPEPSYNITHNETIFITTNKSYTIDVVKYSHAGVFKCVATNRLGSDSDNETLNVVGKT